MTDGSQSVQEVADLRSVAQLEYTAEQPAAAGVSSLYGPAAPFGSAEFARRDAAEITPRSVPLPPEAIPGWRGSGTTGPAGRFLVRIPRRWNGRLVVAGTPSQRSEFACDRLFSDPLLQRGFAYACGNKGLGDGAVLLEHGASFTVEGLALPRFRLPDGRGIAFWLHAPGQLIERWLREFSATTEAARDAIRRVHGREPELTYAVGLSNGGYQVRRAIEESSDYAGALTWNAVLWTHEHNVLRVLPEALEAMEAGAEDRLRSFGFPADVRSQSGAASLYRKNLFAYWYVTAWLHATHLDPQTSLAYGDVRDASPAEAWNGRMSSWRYDRSGEIAERVAGFANNGRIKCKLIEIGSEYDHLISPAVHLEPYRELVAAAGNGWRYRSEIVAGAQHVDSWSEDPQYPQMRVAHPRVIAAFEELVRWVEG